MEHTTEFSRPPPLPQPSSLTCLIFPCLSTSLWLSIVFPPLANKHIHRDRQTRTQIYIHIRAPVRFSPRNPLDHRGGGPLTVEGFHFPPPFNKIMFTGSKRARSCVLCLRSTKCARIFIVPHFIVHSVASNTADGSLL